jgi:hypothetical protein
MIGARRCCNLALARTISGTTAGSSVARTQVLLSKGCALLLHLKQ